MFGEAAKLALPSILGPRTQVGMAGSWPQDFSASCKALEGAGFEELSSLYLADGTRNFSYYTSPKYIGACVELAPMTPIRNRYMTAIEKLANSWDGSRPLRRFGSRDEFIASDDLASAGEPTS